MLRRRATAAMVLAIALAGTTKPVLANLLDAAPFVSGELRDTLENVRYADAMADCAERIHATVVVACDLVPAELERRHSFWIWQSEAGATVSRTRGGDYRVRSRTCLGGFCSWLNCRVTAWPVMACSDGGTLKASVPDPSRFRLGGTDYGRVRQSP